MYLFTLFFISIYSKLDLRMSNYNNKKYIYNDGLFLWLFLSIIMEMNCVSFFETDYQIIYDIRKKISSSFGRIYFFLTRRLACISFNNMYLFKFFFVSTSSKLDLRMSNYNKNKNYR